MFFIIIRRTHIQQVEWWGLLPLSSSIVSCCFFLHANANKNAHFNPSEILHMHSISISSVLLLMILRVDGAEFLAFIEYNMERKYWRGIAVDRQANTYWMHFIENILIEIFLEFEVSWFKNILLMKKKVERLKINFSLTLKRKIKLFHAY